ncbi:THUMP domain-containing protein 2 isoform X4 [Prinia subflava]|uniref:THUMP domain-containing protein 2 isoform X4 n=1 Tax=Prinia subflava TaxID=208062 RepID=UPI002FE181CC
MSPAEPGRFFCTAGRGMEPFLAREVRERLGATEVDCVSGKVFFRAAAGPGELRRLRSGERLFLLLRRRGPLPVSGSRGKMLHEIKSFVIEEPKYWLDIISVWRKLHGHKGKTDDVSQENTLALKRKSEEETNTASKRQKTEQVRAVVSELCQVEAGETCVALERMSSEECWTESKTSSEFSSKGSGEDPAANEQLGFSFRVSCRCSGAIAKILTSQEIGRAIGVTLVKQCGWRADLRDPDLEIFVHLNDIQTVVGIPLFRLPLANREYIKTAGLRSTVAWAMASLAEISEACYWGADISDSQLEGADENTRTAGLMDKIELLKASAKGISNRGTLGSLEGRVPSQQLVAQHPQAPQVHLLLVAAVLHHLGGQVIHGAHSVQHLSDGACTDQAKSAILISPLEPSRRFSGLMSRWITLCLCQYSSVSASSSITVAVLVTSRCLQRCSSL